VKTFKALVVAGAVVALATACTTPTPEATETAPAYADGGAFSMGVLADPGSLNPLNNTSTVGDWFSRFVYEALVTRAADGTIAPGLSDTWEFDGTVATFHIKEGITCSDGSDMTPSVIAKSFAWVKDPANASVSIGPRLPNRDYTFEADDAASTFTLTLSKPFSNLLNTLSFMALPCGSGADDPASLVTTAVGTGPFTLETATPNSEYVFAKRDGYTWGPNGETTDDPGFPDTATMRIIDSESTAANLILSGELNAAVVNGQDRQRLGDFAQSPNVSGGVVMSFSEAEGRVTSDEAVRIALTQAMNRDEVATAVTQGVFTTAGTSISAAEPQICDDSGAADAIPAFDVDGAKATLDDAGWVEGADGTRSKDGVALAFNLGYSTATPGAPAAAELIAAAFEEIGATVTITPLAQADYQQRVFATGDYDVLIQQFSNPFPSTLQGLLGGPFPPDGTNAGHVDNADYKAAIADASTAAPEDACEFWNAASEALFTRADMIPLSKWPTNWVFNGAEMFTLGGRPMPVTIRMLAP
jgi:peptide/nickel transport system substrate-binding protein